MVKKKDGSKIRKGGRKEGREGGKKEGRKKGKGKKKNNRVRKLGGREG